MKFQSICYGNDNNIEAVLKPLANEFGGQTLRVLNPQELSKAFISIIPNLKLLHIGVQPYANVRLYDFEEKKTEHKSSSEISAKKSMNKLANIFSLINTVFFYNKYS